MNEVVPSYMDYPSAYYARCESCRQLVPEDMISLVLMKNDNTEMELCQECHAEARERGVVIEPI